MKRTDACGHSDDQQHYDVLIVGGGMVGATIACGLGQQGIRVAVFDHTEPSPLSVDALPGLRVSALSTASERILRQLGAWSHMQSIRMTPYRRMAVWEKLHSPFGKEIDSRANRVVFDAQQIDHSQLGFIVENRVTQAGLLEAIKSYPSVSFFCPVNIEKIHTSSVSPMIELSDGRRFSGDLLVGADGANSRVRQAAGLAMEQRDYEQQCLVATVEIAGGCQDITWQAFTPTGPEAFLPLPDINGRSYGSIVWYNHPEKVRQLLTLSNEAFIKELVTTFPSALPEIIQLHERGAFPIARRHVTEYFRPGVVLAGDAAHTINPLAGQGVNLGLQDAAWLVEILVDARRAGENPGSPEVLIRYEKARRRDNALMMNTMDAFYHAFSNQSKPLQLLRNLGLRVAGKLSPAVNQVMKYAMGLSGKQPRLAAGKKYPFNSTAGSEKHLKKDRLYFDYELLYSEN
ncbi:FAD-dependent monooxygenase [Endozoicomonas sp. SCSIO W0465]|uniref:FAD-dependent monooxygenase n=1 Tax=Endozoicomonas sp. SCSIO W0465 TaxID=2918516 RepID=UPI002074FAFB|nr:FAD-dependent monooxygenase [Endozoicomonas sp. SCSIO W0465]USE36611.1 FAD-dependent monooxygenase [Endozoicomonas sp. SCSIO W0465]